MSDLSIAAVLVVEDDVRNADLVKVMLNIAGITNIFHCASGKTVIETARQMNIIDVVLLDLQLPGEDGYRILERIRTDKLFQYARIVAFSAQVMPDEINHAEQAGFDGFLGKPLNFDRFPSQIRRLLSGERVWEPR